MEEIDNNQYYTQEEESCINLIKKAFKSFFKGAGILIVIMIVFNLIYSLGQGFKLDKRDFMPLIINLLVGGIGSIIIIIYGIWYIISNKNKIGQETGKGCIVKIILTCIIGPIIVGLLVFGGCWISIFFTAGINSFK